MHISTIQGRVTRYYKKNIESIHQKHFIEALKKETSAKFLNLTEAIIKIAFH